jgi:hypothetical protein
MQPDIRDIKPLIEVPLGPSWQELVAICVAVLLVAVALVWFVRRRMRPKPVVVPPADPPDVVARRALAALSRADLDDLEAVRRFCFALSEIVRAYVEARFGINATDLTTEELSSWVATAGDLSPDLRDILRGLLSATDRVKFAKAEPTRTDCTTLVDIARGFVDQTRGPPPESLAAG